MRNPVMHRGVVFWMKLFSIVLVPMLPAAPGRTGVVELPTVDIFADRVFPPPEVWTYSRVPGTEILSSSSESATRRFVRDFLLLNSTLDVLMPGLRQTAGAGALHLVLCGRSRDFERFLPAAREGERFRTNTLFFEDGSRSWIIVDMTLSELEIDGLMRADAAPAADNEDGVEEGATTLRAARIEADPYRMFYREYFRQLIRRASGTRPQPWLEEGLVQILGGIEFDRRVITLARVGDGMGGAKDGDFGSLLERQTLMPLIEMLQHANTGNPDRIWSAQCYAWAHMCLYGRGQRFQAGFLKLVARLAHVPVSEALVVECFGMDSKKLQRELRGYIDFTDHRFIQFKGGKGVSLPEPPTVDLRDASDAESGRMVGSVLRLAGRTDASYLKLMGPYIRGARDPDLLASLGVDALARSRSDQAEAFLSAAVEGRVDDPRAYLELGRLRYERALGQAGQGDWDDARVAWVLDPLLAACRLKPASSELDEMIAHVWIRSARPPTPAELVVVNQGAVNFPRRPALIAMAAEINLRAGAIDDATELVRHGLAVFREPRVRAVFEILNQRLPVPLPATP